jgi:hypothetical protein
MDSLALKFVLTPALIGLASLVGRHWGPTVSGWLVGLPFAQSKPCSRARLTAWVRLAACSLLRMFDTWFLTVPSAR